MLNSLHGRAVQYDDRNIYVGGRRIGGPEIGRGDIYYVDDSVDGLDGRSMENAVGTLDEAFALCTANQGDIIYVAPDHAETVTGVAGIAHDKAGVTVIGLGAGNQRPRILMDGAATVTYAITADDAFIENIVFAGGHNDIVTCMTTTKKGTHVHGCEFIDNTTDENFLSCITATGAANTSDGISFRGNRALSLNAATVGAVMLNEDVAGCTIRDNMLISEGTGLATIFTCASGKDVKYLDCRNNFLSSKATAGNLGWSNDTASPNNSGIIAHNRVRHADVTAGHILGVVGGCGVFDNLSTSTDAVSGFVLPAIDADS